MTPFISNLKYRNEENCEFRWLYPIEFWIYVEYIGYTEVIARYLINNGFLWRDETCIFIVLYSVLET